jgi:hypothetical protein
MYYKIVNKESEVYKKLHEMRTEELEMEESNKQAITEQIGLEWEAFLGHSGQQNFNRVTVYSGFVFKDPEKVDRKIWKKHSDHKDVFVPNRKTKLGREMSQFLCNGLKGHSYSKVFKIIGIPQPLGRFTFPYVEIFGDIIAIYLGDKQIPTDENIIEITSREFESLPISKDE